VNGRGRALAETDHPEAAFDFEAFFHEHYQGTARVIARVIRDPGRAEELAVEVFWKLWRHPSAHSEKAIGWVHRAAVRAALNELRRLARSNKYEALVDASPTSPNPEQAHAAAEEQWQVRRVLAAIKFRKAELLLLRSDGLSYEELAFALEINPKSVGSLLSRAQETFRKEYTKRYGEPKK